MGIPGVYFLFLEGDNSRCKIGRSGDCGQRLKTHRSTIPWCYYHKIIETENHVGLEKTLHAQYAEQRIDGEWFSLNKEAVDEIVLGHEDEDELSEESSDVEELSGEGVEVIIKEVVEITTTKTSTGYVCEKCGQKFKAERYLKQHQRRKIPCQSSYKCDKCQREFDTAYLLQSHMKRKTPCAPEEISVIEEDNPENRCQFCNRTYSTKSNLKRHLKTCSKKHLKSMMYIMMEQNRRLEEMVNDISKRVALSQQPTANTHSD